MLSQTGLVKRLGRVPWRYRQSVKTPLNNLSQFVESIANSGGGFQGGTATIDQVVFEPKNLQSLLVAHSHPSTFTRGTSFDAIDGAEARALLMACLADWIDFWFVPIPKPFVLYASHDEWISLMANSKSNLNAVVKPLETLGFELI